MSGDETTQSGTSECTEEEDEKVVEQMAKNEAEEEADEAMVELKCQQSMDMLNESLIAKDMQGSQTTLLS